jgi:GT2 family glycosyltransferase
MDEQSQESRRACSFLVTIVIYKKRIESSEAIQSLLACLADDAAALAANFRILLYDNSPEPQGPPHAPGIPIEYRHHGLNDGLAVAYNCALALALAADIPWLMLLDQDTKVTAEYLQEIIQLQPAATQDARLAAFAPKLIGTTGLRSPAMDFLDSLRRQVKLPRWRRPLIVPRDTYGPQRERIVAFNSGAVLRTQALQAIGGFPEEYWLDFLDMAVFHALYQRGWYLFVTNSTLDHALSVEDAAFLQQSTSLARHRNILSAMIHYVKTNGSAWEQLLHRGWLVRNALSLVFRSGGRPFAWASLRQAFAYSAALRSAAGTPAGRATITPAAGNSR